MNVSELRCTSCFAPVDLSLGRAQRCRYCGATLLLDGEVAAAPAGALRLEECGPNKIAVIKVIREHTGLGLREAKDLSEAAPCVLAEWDDAARMERFRADLEAVGARTGAVLEDCGPNKIAVIKVVREYTGLGLKEAKELVESAPCPIEARPTPRPRPVSLRDALLEVGARVR
jgi:large subunit ribosomal protein L7/L12